MNRKAFLKNTAAISSGALFFPGIITQYRREKTGSGLTVESDLWKMSAVDLGKMIRLKKASVSEVIEAHIKRINEINPVVNAVTLLLEEEALKEARLKDNFLLKNSNVSSLFGVPFSVKGNVDLAGYATTEGVKALVENFAETDSPHVGFMRKNGSIALARTNMPDFGLRYHTDNDLFGATINPWNPILTPGGSSGGDAAAVATGMIPIGLGNDYGGSIRYPAQCCGVCGLRPSRGRIAFSTKSLSQGSISESLRRFAVQGPIARRIKDLRTALKIMSDYDPRDPGWVPAPLGNSDKKRFKVALITDPANMGADDSVKNAVRKAGLILQKNGCIIEEIDSTSLRESARLWIRIIATDIQQLHLSAINSYASSGVRKFTDNLINLQADTTLLNYVESLARINGIAQAWEEYFQKYDVILGPVSSRNPFRVGYDIESPESTRLMLESQVLTVSVNLLGLPSVAMPVAITDGIPQAIQIIGPLFRELRCLDLAQIIENEVGIFTPVDPKTA
jgi:amidase